MGRVLAIDYGRALIGLAVSDGLGLTARPLPALQNPGADAAPRALQAVVEEEEVDELVLGLPLKMDGSEGDAVAEVRQFAERLRGVVDLPLHEVDERLTSKQAHAQMKAAGVKHKKRKELVDSTAAVLILQDYLARRRS